MSENRKNWQIKRGFNNASARQTAQHKHAKQLSSGALDAQLHREFAFARCPGARTKRGFVVRVCLRVFYGIFTIFPPDLCRFSRFLRIFSSTACVCACRFSVGIRCMRSRCVVVAFWFVDGVFVVVLVCNGMTICCCRKFCGRIIVQMKLIIWY